MRIQQYSNDKVMLRLYHCLTRDLVSSPLLRSRFENAQTPREIREIELPSYFNAGTETFRKLYQLDNFLKRYIFQDDLHSEKSLEAAAISDFLKSQSLFGRPENLPHRASMVEERAREIVSSILGEFDIEDFYSKCKWGKNASKGLPGKQAYLDVRIERLTCTDLQRAEFLRYLDTDCVMDSFINRDSLELVDHVDYAVVPKSYKAMRGIAPDTVVGGFFSQGLGLLLREKLEDRTPIRLASAQEVHKNLAREGSRSGKYATLDLSKASDSFVWDHITKLVPVDWLPVLEMLRTPNIKIDGEITPYRSYMLMGSGHTFPLQTILFYSLARAATELLKLRGPVRVFGDDIIVPNDCAPYLSTVLADLGFSLNTEKSFWQGNFRESCGGDYFNGCDVRPAMPRGDGSVVSKRVHVSFLFKVYNSLMKKWSPDELPYTVATIGSILHSLLETIPLGIPGVHGEDSCCLYPNETFLLQKHIIVQEGWIKKVKQRILVPISYKRDRLNEHPYYWDSLRTLTQAERDKLGMIKAVQVFSWEHFQAPRHCAGERFPMSENQKGIGDVRYAWKWTKRPIHG